MTEGKNETGVGGVDRRRFLQLGWSFFLASLTGWLAEIDDAEAKAKTAAEKKKLADDFGKIVEDKLSKTGERLCAEYGIQIEFISDKTEMPTYESGHFTYEGLKENKGKMRALKELSFLLLQYPSLEAAKHNFVPFNEHVKKIFITRSVDWHDTCGKEKTGGYADAARKEFTFCFEPQTESKYYQAALDRHRSYFVHEVGHLYIPRHEISEEAWTKSVVEKIKDLGGVLPPDGLPAYLGNITQCPYNEIRSSERPEGFARAYGRFSHLEDIATIIEYLYDVLYIPEKDIKADLILRAKIEVVREMINKKMGFAGDVNRTNYYWAIVSESAEYDRMRRMAAEKKNVSRRTLSRLERDELQMWDVFWTPVIEEKGTSNGGGGGGFLRRGSGGN